jgi:hypothetical protein
MRNATKRASTPTKGHATTGAHPSKVRSTCVPWLGVEKVDGTEVTLQAYTK